jgi:hypothetical protein
MNHVMITGPIFEAFARFGNSSAAPAGKGCRAADVAFGQSSRTPRFRIMQLAGTETADCLLLRPDAPMEFGA